MPNWCSNNVEITHNDPAAVQAVVEAFNRGDLCETFLPIKHIAITGQHDAAINKWGTKWDVGGEDCADRVTLALEGKGVCLSFESAWTPPVGLYNKLVELGYSVKATYFEPGVGFVGEYEDGLDQWYEFDYDNLDQVVPPHLVDEYNIHDCYE